MKRNARAILRRHCSAKQKEQRIISVAATAEWPLVTQLKARRQKRARAEKAAILISTRGMYNQNSLSMACFWN